MTELFGNLETQGLEERQDRVGGFSVHESDIYEAEIKLAYVTKSASSSAQAIAFQFKLPNGDYNTSIWITNKDGQNYKVTDQKKKQPLPGYITVDDIAIMTTDKPLTKLIFEEKTVNLYDFDAKKELPKSVQVATELLGKKVFLGIRKELRDKTEKADNGDYVPTGETREENSVDKVFHYPSRLTVVEAKNQQTEPAFYDIWLDRNKGKTFDRTDKDAAKKGSPAGATKAAAQSTTKSLFGS